MNRDCRFIEQGFHLNLINLIKRDDVQLVVKKNAALCLSSLSTLDSNKAILVKDGMLSALQDTLEDSFIARHKSETAMLRTAYYVQQHDPNNSTRITGSEWNLVTSRAEEFEELKETWRFKLGSPLLESGLALYAHTIFGGKHTTYHIPHHPDFTVNNHNNPSNQSSNRWTVGLVCKSVEQAPREFAGH